MQESNGAPPHNGVSEGGSYSEMKVEIIRARAYELFLGRGAAHGHDLADWLNAERELRARNP